MLYCFCYYIRHNLNCQAFLSEVMRQLKKVSDDFLFLLYVKLTFNFFVFFENLTIIHPNPFTLIKRKYFLHLGDKVFYLCLLNKKAAEIIFFFVFILNLLTFHLINKFLDLFIFGFHFCSSLY